MTRIKNGFVDLNELVADRAGVGLLNEDLFLEYDWDGNRKLSRMEVATILAHQRNSAGQEKRDAFR